MHVLHILEQTLVCSTHHVHDDQLCFVPKSCTPLSKHSCQHTTMSRISAVHRTNVLHVLQRRFHSALAKLTMMRIASYAHTQHFAVPVQTASTKCGSRRWMRSSSTPSRQIRTDTKPQHAHSAPCAKSTRTASTKCGARR